MGEIEVKTNLGKKDQIFLIEDNIRKNQTARPVILPFASFFLTIFLSLQSPIIHTAT